MDEFVLPDKEALANFWTRWLDSAVVLLKQQNEAENTAAAIAISEQWAKDWSANSDATMAWALCNGEGAVSASQSCPEAFWNAMYAWHCWEEAIEKRLGTLSPYYLAHIEPHQIPATPEEAWKLKASLPAHWHWSDPTAFIKMLHCQSVPDNKEKNLPRVRGTQIKKPFDFFMNQATPARFFQDLSPKLQFLLAKQEVRGWSEQWAIEFVASIETDEAKEWHLIFLEEIRKQHPAVYFNAAYKNIFFPSIVSPLDHQISHRKNVSTIWFEWGFNKTFFPWITVQKLFDEQPVGLRDGQADFGQIVKMLEPDWGPWDEKASSAFIKTSGLYSSISGLFLKSEPLFQSIEMRARPSGRLKRIMNNFQFSTLADEARQAYLCWNLYQQEETIPEVAWRSKERRDAFVSILSSVPAGSDERRPKFINRMFDELNGKWLIEDQEWLMVLSMKTWVECIKIMIPKGIETPTSKITITGDAVIPSICLWLPNRYGFPESDEAIKIAEIHRQFHREIMEHLHPGINQNLSNLIFLSAHANQMKNYKATKQLMLLYEHWHPTILRHEAETPMCKSQDAKEWPAFPGQEWGFSLPLRWALPIFESILNDDGLSPWRTGNATWEKILHSKSVLAQTPYHPSEWWSVFLSGIIREHEAAYLNPPYKMKAEAFDGTDPDKGWVPWAAPVDAFIDAAARLSFLNNGPLTFDIKEATAIWFNKYFDNRKEEHIQCGYPFEGVPQHYHIGLAVVQKIEEKHLGYIATKIRQDLPLKPIATRAKRFT